MTTITFNQTTAIEYQNKIDVLIAALPPAPADQLAAEAAYQRRLAAVLAENDRIERLRKEAKYEAAEGL